MFPMIFAAGVEIGFAYTSFKWENNAKNNAGVTVVVIGLRTESSAKKYIFEDGVQKQVEQINGYLADAPNVFVSRRSDGRFFSVPVGRYRVPGCWWLPVPGFYPRLRLSGLT